MFHDTNDLFVRVEWSFKDRSNILDEGLDRVKSIFESCG